MGNRVVTEESLFLFRLEALCRGPAVTCAKDMDVVDAARLMREHDVSGLVVVEGRRPVAVVSVTDLRNLVADSGGQVAGKKVGEIMSSGLVSISSRSYAFEAIFKMAKNGIHRLAVLDDGEQLVGVVTDADFVRIQTVTPLYLSQEIDAAQSVGQLHKVSAKMLDMVNYAVRAGADARGLVELISHFNDALTLRIVALLEAVEGIGLPRGAAYLALGSEGRGEQTLRTDQDSAMVFRDELSEGERAQVALFAARLVDALEEIGVPRCPGDTMASNPRWRHGLSEWKRLLDQWIHVPKPENMVSFGMFQDLRALCGDLQLGDDLNAYIVESVRRHALFLPHMARHIARFPAPLGWFGRIRVERRGDHRGRVDLKKAGIFAITEGVSLLALEAGIATGNTWEKIEALGGQGVLGPGELEIVSESFTFLVKLRLEKQLRALSVGGKPSNYVDPLVLTERERDHFREALKGVGVLQRFIRDRYKLDFISR